MRENTKRRLSADARNRAFRGFLIALLTAAFIDVWPLVNDALTGTDPVQWALLGKAAARVSMQAAGSFILRRVLDPSSLPTPLPPATEDAVTGAPVS